MGTDLGRYRAVIFDVDGTLYDARRLRVRMALELLAASVTSTAGLSRIRRLQTFRRERERLAELEVDGIRAAQYERPAGRLGLPVEELRNLVEEWMEERPLRHLRACRFPGVGRLFQDLREAGITIAVLSDYPAHRKVATLELAADCVVSAVDREVNRMKPHPAGLLRVLDLLGVAASDCLLIGDRDDRDGEAARRAGVACLLKERRRVATPGAFSDYRELALMRRSG